MVLQETESSVMKNGGFVLEQEVLLLQRAVRSFGFHEGFKGGIRFGFAGFGFMFGDSKRM